jgi:hypothetical protein
MRLLENEGLSFYLSTLVDLFQIFFDHIFSSPPRHIHCSRALKILHTTLALERHVNSPSPFARSKSLHAGNYSSIYQVPLDLVIRIFQELDERQHGVNSPQGFDELALVVVVHSTPCQSIPVVFGGSLLR